METNLTSLVVTLSIIGIIASCAYAPLRDTMIATKSRATSENLRVIESAKRQYFADWGIAPSSVDDIAAYCPNGELPKPLREGETYLNVVSLTEVAASSCNGLAEHEPWGNFGPLTSNGYNDLGNAQPARRFVPVIYVQAPQPSDICDLPAIAQTTR